MKGKRGVFKTFCDYKNDRDFKTEKILQYIKLSLPYIGKVFPNKEVNRYTGMSTTYKKTPNYQVNSDLL